MQSLTSLGIAQQYCTHGSTPMLQDAAQLHEGSELTLQQHAKVSLTHHVLRVQLLHVVVCSLRAALIFRVIQHIKELRCRKECSGVEHPSAALEPQQSSGCVAAEAAAAEACEG